MNAKLTFGYLYDFRNPPQWHRDWVEHYADVIDFAVWTESQGFDGAWFPEHHITRMAIFPRPWSRPLLWLHAPALYGSVRPSLSRRFTTPCVLPPNAP